jgi:phosphoribosylpyrophosphate synthetase
MWLPTLDVLLDDAIDTGFGIADALDILQKD